MRCTADPGTVFRIRRMKPAASRLLSALFSPPFESPVASLNRSWDGKQAVSASRLELCASQRWKSTRNSAPLNDAAGISASQDDALWLMEISPDPFGVTFVGHAERLVGAERRGKPIHRASRPVEKTGMAVAAP